MDGHCSRQSIYQTSAGQEHLDFLRLKGLDDSSDEHFRALEPSIRRLSASELEEHHERKAYLTQDASDRWHRWTENQWAHTSEARSLAFPQAKVNNGRGSTHRQLYGKNVDHARPKSRPCPLDLTSEQLWQQHSLGPRRECREQRGYFEFETADQKKRVARMGLGGQKAHGEGTMPQTTLPPRIPDPTNHLFSRTCPPKERPAQQKQGQSKAQVQQNQTPACDQRGSERTNAVLLKAGAKQEAGQWNMAQHSLEDQNLAQQRRDQLTGKHQTLEPKKVQLPTAKPGNLYPGPTRIPEIIPPIHLVHADSREQSIKPELALSVRLKSKMACQEAYYNYKEKERKKKGEGEEQRKATWSIPRYEVTRTESVKQLLASVNKALEPKIEAAEVEVATTNIAECKASRDQSLEPSKGPEDIYEAGPKCGESFWHKYDRNYPIFRQSHDCPVGLENLARDNGPSQREVSLGSSRTSDLQAAVEAIDRTSGDLLGSPNATSDQHESPLASAIAASQNRGENAGLSRTLYDDLSVKTAKHDVAPPSAPQTERTDMSSTLRNHEGGHEDAAVEAAPRGDVDIQLEWEEVDDHLEDDGWISVKQDFEETVCAGSSSSSDLEWASDVASDGAFEL